MLYLIIAFSLLPSGIWSLATTDIPLLTTVLTNQTIQCLRHTNVSILNSCRRGYDGTQGPQGPPGVQGIQGPRGSTGIEGCQGPQGREGILGRQGNTGSDGPSGPPGDTGSKGEKGDRGTCEPGELAPDRLTNAAYAQAINSPLSTLFLVRRGSAFSAARTTPILSHLTNIVMTYDIIYSNLGDDLNAKSGYFTCAINGTYFFHMHIYKHEVTKKPTVRLFKNEEFIMVVDDISPPNVHDSSSTSIILLLVEGDQVWLEVKRKSRMHYNIWRRAMFSGFLLFPTP